MVWLEDALYPLLEADQTILSPIKGPVSGSDVMIPSAKPSLLDMMEISKFSEFLPNNLTPETALFRFVVFTERRLTTIGWAGITLRLINFGNSEIVIVVGISLCVWPPSYS